MVHTLNRRSMMQAAAAAALAVGAPLSAVAAGPLSVVATTGMIADAVRAVGGERVSVRALMGPGVDPHAYRQTRSDIAAMARADLVLWNGLFLEAQMIPFFEDLGRRVPTVAVAETLDPALLQAHDDYADQFDPHVWMDPDIWDRVVAAVRDALIAQRPADAGAFEAAAAAYRSEVAALSAYVRDVLATVPAEQRVLVSAHDAFNYFGAAYDYEVLGIQGISTEAEAGLKRIADLVDLLVERRVGAVFVETSVSDRSVRALIEGAAARGHRVAIGGELYSDAMGPEGSYEGTYLGMIDHNATVIARGLGGAAPAGGRLGRLEAV